MEVILDSDVKTRNKSLLRETSCGRKDELLIQFCTNCMFYYFLFEIWNHNMSRFPGMRFC